jgi:DNA-directed RNA polymerase subunit RPC12/RpoP
MEKYVIKCPNCGYEYLPNEIYYPQDLGNAHNVYRDLEGKILYYDGSNIDTEAEYICDGCKCKFKVKAEVKFFTTEDKKKNVNEEYVIKLKPKKQQDESNLWEDNK